MKKKLCTIIIAMLLITITICFSSCALLFNKGKESELPGIWGIDSATFSGVYTSNYNIGNDFEYYLLIIDKSRNVTVKYKLKDGEEVSYKTTYTPTIEEEVVKDIQLETFSIISSHETSAGEFSYSIIDQQDSLTYSPKSEFLTYKYMTMKKNQNTGSIGFVTTKIKFNKLYDSTSDSKINRAIKKQQSR